MAYPRLMAYKGVNQTPEDIMAPPVQKQPSPNIEAAFVADRFAFWNRFMGFMKFGVVAIVVLLLLMWVFLR